MTQPPDGYRPEPDSTEQVPPAHPPADPEPAAAPPKSGARRRIAITAVTVAVVLAISGGVLTSWLLLRDSDRDGASDPVTAVNSFLEAVYQKQDAAAASAQVCSEARDEAALETKVGTIREYDTSYNQPRFSWGKPEVVEESGQVAIVTVTVTMTTADEKSADQTLHVSVLDKQARGWWVCDVNSVQAAPDNGSDDGGDAGSDRPDGSEEDSGEEDSGEEDSGEGSTGDE